MQARRLFFLLLAPLLSFCDEPELTNGSGCIDRVTSGTRVYQGCRGGLSLTATVPSSCTGGGCGLIFDVHGYRMNADSQNNGTGLRSLVLRDGGYVLIQPTDPDNNWDPADGADGHVVAAIEAVAAAYQVDRDRIHFGGFSQGGWMSWRLMCSHSHLIASFASISGGDTTMGPGAGGRAGICFGRGAGNPGSPMLHIHGTADRTVSYRSAESIRDRVVAAMGDPAGLPVGPGRIRWTGAGMHYELVTHQGAHCIQSCQREIQTGRELLEFYKNHPRP